MEQTGNELKTQLISDYVESYAQEYLDSQVELELSILETFEQLMSQHPGNSEEYKNALIEHNKQLKTLDYFKSDSFDNLYKSEYKKQMEVLTLEQVQHLVMQQELIMKVRDISKNMTNMVIDLADNIAGETKLSA